MYPLVVSVVSQKVGLDAQLGKSWVLFFKPSDLLKFVGPIIGSNDFD